jgi:putative protease
MKTSPVDEGQRSDRQPGGADRRWVRSFKIEGRYKDMSYVKNITAHYRQMLDAIIEDRGDLARASAGRTEHFFIPSTDKTFHRGSTDYFVNARKGDIGAFDSPKFIGLPVGEV